MKNKKGNYLWRLQKGNPVEWRDGHKKGTGVIVKPFHETKIIGFNGKHYYGSPDGFYVRDDVTGETKLFLNKQIFIRS